MKLQNARREYLKSGLNRKQLNANPFEQLKQWLQQASSLELIDHTAMTLATVNAQGQPSQRVVLLKQLDEKGLVFFTNLTSRKAKDMAQNNQVSANFTWLPLERQIKIQGIAEKISHTESLKYFLSRPRNSQLAAWASHQSQVIPSRQILMQTFEQMKARFAKGEIPLPDFWGGFRIKPQMFDFWQGREARLHDSFRYTKVDSSWHIERLAP